MSHAGFLRDVWPGDKTAVDALIVDIVAAVGRGAGQAPTEAVETVIEALVAVVKRTPGFDGRQQALMRFVGRLTLAPASMRRSDTEALRGAAFDDGDIHDIVHVVACFSYMNRMADALGVTVTEARYEQARHWFGEEALAAHLRWSAGVEDRDL